MTSENLARGNGRKTECTLHWTADYLHQPPAHWRGLAGASPGGEAIRCLWRGDPHSALPI